MLLKKLRNINTHCTVRGAQNNSAWIWIQKLNARNRYRHGSIYIYIEMGKEIKQIDPSIEKPNHEAYWKQRWATLSDMMHENLLYIFT